MSKTIKPNVEHIRILLDFLYQEVMSAGGDGDAIWYTKLYDIADIRTIIIDYNRDNNLGWDLDMIDDNTLNFGIGQEWITITNDFKTFNESPDWIQIKIQY